MPAGVQPPLHTTRSTHPIPRPISCPILSHPVLCPHPIPVSLLLSSNSPLPPPQSRSCKHKCADEAISHRNHYWDKKETPRFGEMMSRYEHHMLLYQRLQHACDVDFRIARTEHCDSIL